MIICLILSFLLLSFSLLFYFLGLYFMYFNSAVFIELDFLHLKVLSVSLSIYLDWISMMFTSFVLLISSMVIMFSGGYMEHEKNLARFIFLVVLFVFSMMMLILSSSMVFILLGWDGLGLVSYILVVYYQNMKSYNAGMITALSNRLGDSSILLSIAMMMDGGSWSFAGVLDILKFYDKGNFTVLVLLIILASFTKSAQIPFSSWLPAAMAAPTPVSALVHSSTLVTAGVYLLFRFSDFLSFEVKAGVFYFSLFTMLMAGLGANFEFDLKKIIALSTLSQLGMMMVIFFMGGKDLAFFHLLMHALFKALLFMCAGLIIHSVGGSQDIRSLGGLAKIFPITCSCFCVSSMSLCGLPFLSGFYSKDLIAEILSMSIFGSLIYSLFFFSIGLTVCYSVRLFMCVFTGTFNMLKMNYLYETEVEIMCKSFIGLVFLVILKGSVLSWIVFSTPYLVVLPFFMKMATLGVVLLGILVGFHVSNLEVVRGAKSLDFFHSTMFLSGMWNLPIVSTSSLNSEILKIGKVYIKSMDYGWAEFYGSKGLFWVIKSLAGSFQLIIQNHLKIFLLAIWVGLLYFLVFMIF
uniref:NADH-ubiquinone oxidoreductase chain 5 n=1 Tax=Trigonopterus selaruensis TaxID=2678945 RepID=A0A7H1KHQ8_9CUCU|nr:NADH dehydrogenase subunit 5 [Trigonopterus selaruensis]QNT26824.1 NADH dehydrogenase subunit 5 [Trigonopterus selaruensis]